MWDANPQIDPKVSQRVLGWIFNHSFQGMHSVIYWIMAISGCLLSPVHFQVLHYLEILYF